MFSRPCNQSVYIDPATGKHPFLVTTDSIFTYELADVVMTMDGIPRTIRMARAVEVYIPNGNATEYRQLMLDPYRQGSEAVAEVKPDRMAIKCTTPPATEVVAAKVIFENNPGTQSARYMVKALIEPLRLTEDTIPLMIEEQWEADIIEGTLALIERSDYGRSDRWNYFVNDACQRFWAQGNEGNHTGKVIATPPRAF
jgi:hypothetical protein